MRRVTHENYDKLTEKEKQFVNYILVMALEEAIVQKMKLATDDRCEFVAEEMATWIIESRVK